MRKLTTDFLDRISTLRFIATGEHHQCTGARERPRGFIAEDRKSTRLNSSHQIISYAVFCLKKKKMLRSNIFARAITYPLKPAACHHRGSSCQLRQRHSRSPPMGMIGSPAGGT